MYDKGEFLANILRDNLFPPDIRDSLEVSLIEPPTLGTKYYLRLDPEYMTKDRILGIWTPVKRIDKRVNYILCKRQDVNKSPPLWSTFPGKKKMRCPECTTPYSRTTVETA